MKMKMKEIVRHALVVVQYQTSLSTIKLGIRKAHTRTHTVSHSLSEEERNTQNKDTFHQE